MDVIIINEMTKKEAKTKIKSFFDENKEDYYPSDISKKLHIEYELVLEICEELVNEGLIGER